MYGLKTYHFYYFFLVIYFIVQLYLLGFLKIFEYDGSFKTKKLLNLYNNFLSQLRNNSQIHESKLYRIVYIQSADNNSSTFDITLISQCSFNHIQMIEDLYATWQGPLSISVFVEVEDLKNVLWELTRLFYCNDKKNLKLQIVVPNPGFNIIHKDKMDLVDEKFEELIFCKSYLFIKKKNYEGTKPYPVNLLRNVAKSQSQTEYILVVDIDMVPSINLRQDFLNYIKSRNEDVEATAFVVPVFEIDYNVMPPLTKKDLIKEIKLKRARPFYFIPCRSCQKYTKYNKWLMSNTSSGTKVLYDVHWKHPWEPFFIANQNIPNFDERFEQYGMNRVSQICELHVAGYKFSILDNVFLVHKGFKKINEFHDTKNFEMETNRKLYKLFQEDLKFKYRQSSRKC